MTSVLINWAVSPASYDRIFFFFLFCFLCVSHRRTSESFIWAVFFQPNHLNWHLLLSIKSEKNESPEKCQERRKMGLCWLSICTINTWDNRLTKRSGLSGSSSRSALAHDRLAPFLWGPCQQSQCQDFHPFLTVPAEDQTFDTCAFQAFYI